MDWKRYFSIKDLRKIPLVGIHYEQKTTPDLLWCVADVVVHLTQKNHNLVFTDTNVRESEMFNTLMHDYFSKAKQGNAENEYNKLSSYQLGLLVFSSVLLQVGSRPKKYKVASRKALEEIAENDFKAAQFLGEYTTKFLIDNDLIKIFEKYRNNPNQENYSNAKKAYWVWAKSNTGIRGENHKHTSRVFNKIFNVYCYKYKLPGEDGSNVTIGACPYSLLIYNRENFRDKDMPTGMTRQEYRVYREEILKVVDQKGVVYALLQRAKRLVKDYHLNESELLEPEYGYQSESGVHVHHIFPRSHYPQFSLVKENLIALTPGQHLSRAHIQSNTTEIDGDYQKICLLRKLDHVIESRHAGDGFYDLEVFVKMLQDVSGKSIDDSSSVAEIKGLISQI